MKPVRTWIVIADAARARVLLNDGPGRGLTPVEGHVFGADHAATRDIVSDRQGRSFSSSSPRRSSIESHSDPHRNLKKEMAAQLANMLAAELNANAYDRLVIVAPPTALGDLRASLSDRVRAKVVGEAALDLTKTPNPDVGKHIEHLLAL